MQGRQFANNRQKWVGQALSADNSKLFATSPGQFMFSFTILIKIIIRISQHYSRIVVLKGVSEPVCSGNIVSLVRTRAVVVLKRIPSTASEPPPCLCRFHERQPSDLSLGKVSIRATVVNNQTFCRSHESQLCCIRHSAT